MKYEITIRELEEFTKEELEDMDRKNRQTYPTFNPNRFSDKNYHEKRVLFASLTDEEFKAIKKAVINIF